MKQSKEEVVIPEVVRCESFPEREETFVPGNFDDDVNGPAVLRFSVDDLHVLDPKPEFKIIIPHK